MSLPKPAAEASALSDQLLSQIMAEIKTHRAISFARYMELALYAPQLGYYRNAYQKFGKEGDFVTAPEISPLFSYCLAHYCAEKLAELEGGDILEFGAGSGVMAVDILSALKKQNQLPAHYFILELSASLKSQQYETIKNKIPELLDRVVWLSELPKNPIKGVVLANEVLDAMPVHLFTYKNGIKECVVTAENNQLKLIISENSDLAAEIEKYDIAFSEGYTSEVNLNISGWIKSISDCLSQGAVVLIDYGFLREEYYHPDRCMGTLMCHYRHYAHADSFFLPGLQDITAHVDFTAVGEAAEHNGFVVDYYGNQASFLLGHNLLLLINTACDEKARFLQNQQIMQLTSPSEMGELFKVMVLSK